MNKVWGWTAQQYSSCEYKTPNYYHFQFMNFKWTLKLTLVSQGGKIRFKESKEENMKLILLTTS